MKGTWSVDYTAGPRGSSFGIRLVEPDDGRDCRGEGFRSSFGLADADAEDPGEAIAHHFAARLNEVEGWRSRWAQFTTEELSAIAHGLDPRDAPPVQRAAARRVWDEVTEELGKRA